MRWERVNTQLCNMSQNDQKMHALTLSALPLVGVGQRHAQLGHAVPLQQLVPGQLLPAQQNVVRQRRAAADHQPQPLQRADRIRNVGGILLADALQHTRVHGGHAHEQRHGLEVLVGLGKIALVEPFFLGEALPHDRAGGGGQKFDRATSVQHAEQLVHQAVDVVQRQEVEDLVL